MGNKPAGRQPALTAGRSRGGPAGTRNIHRRTAFRQTGRPTRAGYRRPINPVCAVDMLITRAQAWLESPDTLRAKAAACTVIVLGAAYLAGRLVVFLLH